MLCLSNYHRKFILDFTADHPDNWLRIHGFYGENGTLATTEFEVPIFNC